MPITKQLTNEIIEIRNLIYFVRFALKRLVNNIEVFRCEEQVCPLNRERSNASVAMSTSYPSKWVWIDIKCNDFDFFCDGPFLIRCFSTESFLTGASANKSHCQFANYLRWMRIFRIWPIFVRQMIDASVCSWTLNTKFRWRLTKSVRKVTLSTWAEVILSPRRQTIVFSALVVGQCSLVFVVRIYLWQSPSINAARINCNR